MNDGTLDSPPAVLVITVNTAPTAHAGTAQEVFDDGPGKQKLRLDGSKSSDPEAGKGQTLTYTWTCPTASPSTASGPTPALEFPIGVHVVQLAVSDGVESSQATVQVSVRGPASAVDFAASPSALGRTGEVPDVFFYLLLPEGRKVADVDRQAFAVLQIREAKLPLPFSLDFDHKQSTVVVVASREMLLEAAGAANGFAPVKMSLRLKSGETIIGMMNIQIIATSGPSQSWVLAERSYYYYDTKTWK